MSRLGKTEDQGEAQHLSAADRGVAEVSGWVGPGAPQRSRGLVQAWFMRTVGSRAGGLLLNLALLQTSLPWRSAVPTAKHSGEGRNM